MFLVPTGYERSAFLYMLKWCLIKQWRSKLDSDTTMLLHNLLAVGNYTWCRICNQTCIILALLWGEGQISDFVKLCCCSPEGLLPQGQSMLLLALQSGIFWYLVRDLILHVSVTYTSSTPRQWEYILFSKAGNHLGSPSHSLCYRWNSQDQSNKVLLQNQEQGMQV